MSEQDDRELRNAVFAAKEAQERGIQTITKEDALKRDFGLDIPTSLVPIPSKGLIYPSSHPLHMKEVVEIRGMTTREEDILMSRALIRKGTVISELIKSCMITRDVDVTSLIGGDRNALMVAIRILGYGSEYVGSMDCPSCQIKNTITVDLNTLEIKDLAEEPSEPGANLFSFKLPQCGLNVTFKLLTGREEEEIMGLMESKKKKGIQNESVISTRLNYSIVSIGNISDRTKIQNFIGAMPARDSNALRHHMDKIEPGIDMKFNFACSACGHEEVMPLPLGPSFFWPNAR